MRSFVNNEYYIATCIEAGVRNGQSFKFFCYFSDLDPSTADSFEEDITDNTAISQDMGRCQ